MTRLPSKTAKHRSFKTELRTRAKFEELSKQIHLKKITTFVDTRPHATLQTSLVALEQKLVNHDNILLTYQNTLNSLPKSRSSNRYKHLLSKLLPIFIVDLTRWIDLQIEEDVDDENGWVEIGEKLEEYLRTINPD